MSDKVKTYVQTFGPMAVIVVWVLLQTFARADGDTRWVPQGQHNREITAMEKRLDRMEEKIDRLLERK